MAIETTNQPAIKVGDHVRFRSDGEYLGKAIGEQTKRFIKVQFKDNDWAYVDESFLEVTPKLAPDEAWAELPFTILGRINALMSWGAVRLHEYEQKAIRHEAYKLLGGAGIKVDESVKARVRKAIERIAEAMGVELS